MSNLPTPMSAGRLLARLPATAHACERSAQRVLVDGLKTGLRRAAVASFSRLVASRLAAAARRELVRMDDRTLRDIGLERAALLELFERGLPRLRRAPCPC